MTELYHIVVKMGVLCKTCTPTIKEVSKDKQKENDYFSLAYVA
jgi:hypothetical protein